MPDKNLFYGQTWLYLWGHSAAGVIYLFTLVLVGGTNFINTVYNTWTRVGYLQGLFTINMPTWCIYQGSQFRILELAWEGSLITVTDFKQPKMTQKYLLFLLWLIMMSDLAWLSSSGRQRDCYTVPATRQTQDNSQGCWSYHSGQKRKWGDHQEHFLAAEEKLKNPR